MTYQVKTEKVIARPAQDVFRAIQEGRLFSNCGASLNTMQIDFRVGGKYKFDMKLGTLTNFGEFIEIVPNKRVVFTWCAAFGPDQKPDTQVAIDLIDDGTKTKLMLEHTGFSTEESRANHEGGWKSVVNDFSEEITTGRLRFVRNFKAPVETLFATCKNPETFFAYMGDLAKGKVDVRVGGKYQLPTAKGEVKGEFLEIVPNKKIKLSWLAGCGGVLENSHVTLNFTPKPDGTSSLELIHDGLVTDEDQRSHRGGWESVAKELSQTLSR